MGLFDGVANWLEGTDDQSGSVNYLPPDDELRFRSWYKKWADKTGLNPNPDDPYNQYDFREAYKNGIEPYHVDGKSEEDAWEWPAKQRADGQTITPTDRSKGTDVWTGNADGGVWADPLQHKQFITSEHPRPKTLGDIPGGSPGLDDGREMSGSTLSDFGENVITGLGDSAAGIIDLADLAGKKLLKTRDNLENFIGLATHARGPVSVPPYEEGDEHPLPEDVEGAAQELHGKYEDARDRVMERHPNLYGAILTTGADAANQAIQVAATEGIGKAEQIGGRIIEEGILPDIADLAMEKLGPPNVALSELFTSPEKPNSSTIELLNKELDKRGMDIGSYWDLSGKERDEFWKSAMEEDVASRKASNGAAKGVYETAEENGTTDIADLVKTTEDSAPNRPATSVIDGDYPASFRINPPERSGEIDELWKSLPPEGKQGDNKDFDAIKKYVEENWGKPKGIGDETPNLNASEKKWEEVKNSPDVPSDPYAEAKKTDPESEGYNPFFNDPRSEASAVRRIDPLDQVPFDGQPAFDANEPQGVHYTPAGLRHGVESGDISPERAASELADLMAASRGLNPSQAAELQATLEDGFRRAAPKNVSAGSGWHPPPTEYDPNFVASNEYDPPPGGSGGPVIPEDEKGPYTGSTRDLKFDYVGSINSENYASAVQARALNKRFGKQNMEDLSFFLEGTGNPLAPKGENEYSHAFARLNSTQEGREAMQWALHEDLPKNKELYDELDKLGIPLEDYIDNYVKHVWNLDPSDARKFTNTIKSTDAFQKSRSISTLEQGINRGMVPRSVNYAELGALRDRAMTRVKATNELLDNMSRLPPVGDLPAMVRQVPREAEDLGGGIGQYHSVNVPALAGILEDTGMPGKGGRVYVLNDYYDTLKPILESTSATKLDQLISTTKALNLSFSLMHPFNIAKRAAQNFGLVRGALEVAKTGGGIPGLYRLMGPAFEATSSAAEKIGLQRIARLLGRPGIDVARDGMLHGLELSAPELDTMQSSFYNMMDNLERRLPRGLDSVAKGIAATRRTFDTALWPEMVSPLKVAGYQNNLAYLTRVQSGKGGVSGGLARMIQGKYGKAIADMSDTELKRTAARFSNDLYGGQNWRLVENKFWSDPKTTAAMRRVFISPDWKYSAINTSLAPASLDPAMRALGNRHYIQSAFGIFAAANVMNYMMTMGSQQGPHFMWENERGKKTQLQTPFTKDDGRGHQRQTFWDIGKLDREAWDFFLGKENEIPVLGSAARSVLPIWQNMISTVTGSNLAGFPGHEKRLREQVKRPLTTAERVGTNVRQQVDTFLPFNVERAFQDPNQIVNPMTESMGMSEGKAGDYLYKAYYDQDSKAANEIIQTLGRNGYSSESIDKVVKEAQKKVLKEKYGIKFDGSE